MGGEEGGEIIAIFYLSRHELVALEAWSLRVKCGFGNTALALMMP